MAASKAAAAAEEEGPVSDGSTRDTLEVVENSLSSLTRDCSAPGSASPAARASACGCTPAPRTRCASSSADLCGRSSGGAAWSLAAARILAARVLPGPSFSGLLTKCLCEADER